MDGNYTDHGNHFVMYRNTELLYFAPGTNIMLQIIILQFLKLTIKLNLYRQKLRRGRRGGKNYHLAKISSCVTTIRDNFYHHVQSENRPVNNSHTQITSF